MRRQRTKKFVNLGHKQTASRDVVPARADGLPEFRPFFFSTDPETGNKRRVWLAAPSDDEREEASLADADGRLLIGNAGIKTPLVPALVTSGLSRDFAEQIACLVIKKRQHQKVSKGTITQDFVAIRNLGGFLSRKRGSDCRKLSLTSLSIEDFIEYRNYLTESGISQAQGKFNVVSALFSQEGTPFSGDLKSLSGRHFISQRNKPSPESTSTLFRESDGKHYSESVMFQLLCLFVFDFERSIQHLKEYDSLTLEEMRSAPDFKFIAPGEDPSNTIPTAQRSLFAKKKNHNKWDYEAGELLRLWLSDEQFYPVLLKHEMTWHKFYGVDLYRALLSHRKFRAMSPEMQVDVQNYNRWINEQFGLPAYMEGNINLTRVCVTDSVDKVLLAATNNKPATVLRRRVGYSLVNMILMATGLNREVPLSWPSKIDGKSILEEEDEFFKVSDSETATDISITGIKRRCGNVAGLHKEITCNIPKASPLHRMLKQYERYVKVDFEGPFFEFPAMFRKHWKFTNRECVPGKDEPKKVDVFSALYPVYYDNGQILTSLETKKFRKVFGKSALFDLMKEAKNATELAKLIKEAFQHGNLDTTLSHYLIKEPDARHVIDLTIATITSEKMNELSFSGQIITNSARPKGSKSRPLCECEDPSNPTHGFSVATECRKYDLCLGCKRSMVMAKHLPYICLRILQYEEKREGVSAANWSAFFEDRWMIAKDALEQYAKSDKKNGQHLIDEAWIAAKSGKVKMPPIIMPEVGL